MIYFIAAVDDKLGMANENGIPWQGKVPGDVAYFRKQTLHQNILMGYGTYTEFKIPLTDRHNYVASSKKRKLRPGFEQIMDVKNFLLKSKENIWVIGGPSLFAATINLADKIYLTRLEGEFNCTKFFPEFTKLFKLESRSSNCTNDEINYVFEVWKKI